MKYLSLFLIFLLLVTSVFARKRSDGVWHQVRPKQTLWRIAYTYNIPISKIREANNIKDLTRIKTGDWLFIPGVDTPREVSVYENKNVESLKYSFIWPVTGKILNRFKDKNNQRFNGIDIQAAHGDFVKSAGDGIVKYVGNIRGYGNVVIIKHNDVYASVYGCLDEILVKELQNIKSGKIIGKIGKTQADASTFLHFEIIKDGYPIDPLKFLKS